MRYVTDSTAITARELRNQALVRSLVPEGMVLLKNDGVLPFDETVCTVALFGKGARKTVKGGTGSGDVNVRETVTIERGLIQSGIHVKGSEWLDEYDRLYEESRAEYRKQVKEKTEAGVPLFSIVFGTPFAEPMAQPITEQHLAQAEAPAALYVISRNSGEGADRRDEPGDYRLSEQEIADIRLLADTY